MKHKFSFLPENRIERRLEKKSIVTPYGSEDVTINSNGIDQHEYR